MQVQTAKKWNISYIIVPLSILLVMVCVMMFTGLWPWKANVYNSYSLQAKAWLEGRLDLGQNYEWLELAIRNGRYYVSFPPFPSYMLLPFVWIFGVNTPDHIIAMFVTVVGAIYAMKLYRHTMRTEKHMEFFVLLLYLASGYLFLGMTGYVWFIAQSMCFTLSLMSLYYAECGKGGWALGLWACAVGCRPMVAVYGLLIARILWKQWKKQDAGNTLKTLVQKKWYWCIGTGLIAISYMVLNYMRFGSVIEFGHNYLPEFTRTSTGQFHISYFWNNLKNYLRLPKVASDGGMLQFFNADGMAFWFIAPIFITFLGAFCYRIVVSVKEKDRRCLDTLVLIPILAAVHVFILCCHRTLGGWQFGNRYLVDLMPYLFYGYLQWKAKTGDTVKWNIPIMVWGCSINLLGTVLTYNYWI